MEKSFLGQALIKVEPKSETPTIRHARVTEIYYSVFVEVIKLEAATRSVQ